MWSCRRILGGVGVVLLVAIVPTVATATSPRDGSRARLAAAGPIAYGGFTAQNWPVAIEVSRDRREVVRTAIGFELSCNSGIRVDLDRYRDIVLHRNGRFSSTYSGLRTNPLADGTFYTLGGSVSGRLNAARTTISGTATFNYTQHDAAGTVVNTCDSGRVKFKAR